MKKNIVICTLLVSYFFTVSSQEENNFSFITEKPNIPKINRPLPEEAYQSVHYIFRNDFSTTDTEFIMFLQNRFKKSKSIKNLEEEDKLIDSLCNNFINNKKLTAKDLSKCAFAAGVEHLYFHQFIADTRTYPSNYLLTPFEQNYNFKLYPTTPIAFLALKSSLPAGQKALYKQTTIRNFAKFLLITLSRK